MADFTILAPEPFTVEGTGGTIYELPRIKDLSAEQVAAMGKINEAKCEAAQLLATREFVLGLCPELANEPLSDVGYSLLFKDLAKGSGISMGES